MNKTLTEIDVESFLAKFKASDNDKRTDQVQFFGLQLENAEQLPPTTLDALTLTVAPLLRSSSHLLVAALLNSFLPFYIPLLPSSPPTHLNVALIQFLPPLLEKINDPKERIHIPAGTCVEILGRNRYEAEAGGHSGTAATTGKGKEKESLAGYWERNVKETMAGKGWRAKVECMKILQALRTEENARFPLKPWISPLVDLLEDSDSNVRDQARETVVALMAPSSTPPAARSELKKLIAQRNVRKTIADGIMNRVFAGDGALTSGTTTPDLVVFSHDTSTGTNSRSETPAADDVEVVHIASGKDLEHEFADMAPHFEGKETEHNWGPREASIVRIRGVIKSGAFTKYPESFMIGLKAGVMEGISKTLLSLRTTLAQQSCAVVQELIEALGSSFDPFVEHLLPILAKMAGFTKKIIAEKSQRCVSTIIVHTTCHPRISISHIAAGAGEKNVQVRQYTVGHLKLFIETNGARSKTAVESIPALLDTLEGTVAKFLGDTSPHVRELARSAFWAFNGIWPIRGQSLLGGLDGAAKKQLEKAKPGAGEAAPSRPAAKKPVASSAMSALLAEKRRAKAAELAAGRIGEHPRTVSSPVPAPASPAPVIARSSSAQFTSPRDASPLRKSSTNADGPGSPSPPPLAVPRQAFAAKKDSLGPSSSLARSLSRSPDSTKGSPSRRSLGHLGTPTARSAGPKKSVHTPTHPGTPLIQSQAPDDDSVPDQTPSRSWSHVPEAAEIDPKLKRQAEDAVSAAEQLLDVGTASSDALTPSTPAKLNGAGLTTPSESTHFFRTPLNKLLGLNTPSRPVWDDSPRPEAMTPLLFAQLKERKHERSWWLKRQELMDKASPLKSAQPDAATAILPDLEELESGSPSLKNLQKLALFIESHPIGGEDAAKGAKVWKDGKLFDRVFKSLASFLEPSQPIGLLEQALVVLWELVQHQWLLFEDREDALADTLFRLRACSNTIILESTNSLISLLVEVSEPLYFFSVLSSALERFLAAHPTDEAKKDGVVIGDDARASGYLFGLTALGMCVLKLPREVVEVETGKLAPLITKALGHSSVTTRQAANVLILAIQAVVGDAQVTLGLLSLDEGQKNLVHYLMEKNGLLRGPDGDGRERVADEMAGLLGRGTAR